MTKRCARLTGNRRVTAALLFATLVLAVAFAQRLLFTISSLIVFAGQDNGQNSATTILSGLFLEIALGLLPFVIGAFLCTWLVAPVAAELGVISVVWRSLLAAVAGAIIVFVVTLAGSLLTGFDTSAGLVYGWAAGAAVTAASNVGWAISQAVYSAVNMAIAFAPLTVLDGLLVWFWLRTTPVAAVPATDTAEV